MTGRGRRAGIVGGAVLAAGLVAGGATYAATGGGGDPAADLAQALNANEGTNLTAEDITEAMTDLLEQRLDAAVADGRLTQEQADRMLERAQERGGLPLFGGPGHGPRGGGPALLEPAADALGIEREALHERLHDGDTMAEIASEEGVAVASVVAAVKQAILDSPRGGNLTDDQAQERAERIVNEPRPEGPRGRFGPPPGP